MINFKRLSFLIIILTNYFSAFSQSINEIVDIGDLILTNGERIMNCRVGFRTIGKVNENSTNVIVYPTWFEGTSEDIINLIRKYNFIDTTKYFIIAIDAPGNGESSSPSNYNYDFPQITIRDMINSQYRLLKYHFHLNKIKAVIGGSMGGMQALEWAAAYPEYAEKVVSYSGTPKISSYDLLWMNTLLEVIEKLKEQGLSEKEIIKIKNMMIAMIARTPEYVNEKTDLENFQTYLLSFEKEPKEKFTLDDYVIQLKALMEHDITKDYNNSYQELAKKIKTEIFIIVSETDMMVNPEESLKLADVLGCRKLILNNNCGHLAPSCEIERVREEINQFLDE